MIKLAIEINENEWNRALEVLSDDAIKFICLEYKYTTWTGILL